MQRFKAPEQAQRSLACFESLRGHFCPRRHRLSAVGYRAEMADRFQTWRHVTGLATA
jgi:putative transposase